MKETTVSVFSAGDAGGNPCTIVEGRRSGEEMIALARTKGHECCLAVRESPRRYAVRFFAPSGEMDMCAHASAAAAWLVGESDGSVTTFTSRGGVVRGFKSGLADVSISQPRGYAEPCDAGPALLALGLSPCELASGAAVVNAASTRAKTLVPIAAIERLQRLDPDPDDVRVACDVLGSTGLYPWVATAPNQIEARQFPRGAGYREDPATGVAAAALFFALGAPQSGLTVDQGRAMGRLSRISVLTDPFGDGCLLSGRVRTVARTEDTRMSAIAS
ncbi:MAG TPA: PhzF family phenazine biosynthesis protein [Sphingomicrobium sp.]|nr:PhzF family phenazine biosynthesis protein [Sphingomicrobium sp.]